MSMCPCVFRCVCLYIYTDLIQCVCCCEVMLLWQFQKEFFVFFYITECKSKSTGNKRIQNGGLVVMNNKLRNLCLPLTPKPPPFQMILWLWQRRPPSLLNSVATQNSPTAESFICPSPYSSFHDSKEVCIHRSCVSNWSCSSNYTHCTSFRQIDR